MTCYDLENPPLPKWTMEHGWGYYVDATAGKDYNPGTEELPWRTIDKVNSTTFLPGSIIYFKRGETWTGTLLVVHNSGEYGNPITFGAYGTGDDPIIDGDDAVNCVYADGRSYLRFEGIECAHGLNAGFYFVGCAYVDVVDCSSHGAGNDNLLFVERCHHCTVTRGEYHDAWQLTPGTAVSGIEIADECHDITITDAMCYDNFGYGITLHHHASLGYETSYNITITGAECYGNGSHGITVSKDGDTEVTDCNIVITDCILHDNTTNGLRVSRTGTATTYMTGVRITNCLFYVNGDYAMYINADDVYIAECQVSGWSLLIDCNDIVVYNNTWYFAADALLVAFRIGGTGRTDTIVARNNIFMCETTSGYPVYVAAGNTTGVDIDYSLHYGPNPALAKWVWDGVAYSYANWLINSGQDASSPALADPMMNDPGNEDFTLQAGSPAIGTGTDVGYGDDIGAVQYAV